jgi:site-specific DNA-cytosine methylase
MNRVRAKASAEQLIFALYSPGAEAPTDDEELEDCLWSANVALDPRHRPQVWHEPSSTVRREWCRYPQEAHLLDEVNCRYRRLTPDEMAILQGFAPDWFDVPGLFWRNRVRAIGDAVPPALAKAVIGAVDSVWNWRQRTAVEICAGSGGLSSGARVIDGLEHLLLLDRWQPSCDILRHRKPWPAERVVCGDVKAFDFARFRGQVGLLSGGPPCQPWSQGGRQAGFKDPRDLLATIDGLVAELMPEAFVFENVPGLVGEQNIEYLEQILCRLKRPAGSAYRYGVMAGVLNAADFGVPQIRRRVFLVGLRDAPASQVHSVFDRIYANATHRDPSIANGRRERWVTLQQAFGGRPDPGGWRKWIDRPVPASA